VTRLRALLDEHEQRPFPASVVKGLDYAGVDCVMVGADIYGWASRVAGGEALRSEERERFLALRTALASALPAFPDDARPYYATLVEIADIALGI
jgi:hypothetical protein